MGLLDDAIREHLELKRRRGADPDEIARQEDEAPWLDDDRGEPGQPTAEFTPPDVEPEPEVVRPDDEPAAEEDVLEETPEFLQETPEHERLWFEQKPPRDFDWDR